MATPRGDERLARKIEKNSGDPGVKKRKGGGGSLGTKGKIDESDFGDTHYKCATCLTFWCMEKIVEKQRGERGENNEMETNVVGGGDQGLTWSFAATQKNGPGGVEKWDGGGNSQNEPIRKNMPSLGPKYVIINEPTFTHELGKKMF